MEAVDSVMEVDSAMEVVGLVMEVVDSAVEGEVDSAMEAVDSAVEGEVDSAMEVMVIRHHRLLR